MCLRCELLKSLVLPGLGAFTIVDERKVGGEDVGNNFFLDHESVGENRGVVATRLLVEMNHEVRGDAVEDSPEDILRNKPGEGSRPSQPVIEIIQPSLNMLLGLIEGIFQCIVPISNCGPISAIAIFQFQGFVSPFRLIFELSHKY